MAKGYTHAIILEKLNRSRSKIGRTVYSAYIKRWGLHQYKIVRSNEKLVKKLILKIERLCYRPGLSDQEISYYFSLKGFEVPDFIIKRIRFDLGISKKITNFEQRKESDRLIKEELRKAIVIGKVQRYRRRYIYNYLRS